jgi:hypothetical protein
MKRRRSEGESSLVASVVASGRAGVMMQVRCMEARCMEANPSVAGNQMRRQHELVQLEDVGAGCLTVL